ncbi:MAG TPA: hypothetical protein VL754_19850 [Verrucomicrobiae bacterium]|jgi:hypothetical protein|nr:hypothetical protein [Verrucomicrobiae bacterium]
MDTPLSPLETRRQVLALLGQLRAAERAVQSAQGAVARMIEFEQRQLFAELERLPGASEIDADATASFGVQTQQPWSLTTALSVVLESFVSALKTRTA